MRQIFIWLLACGDIWFFYLALLTTSSFVKVHSWAGLKLSGICPYISQLCLHNSAWERGKGDPERIIWDPKRMLRDQNEEYKTQKEVYEVYIGRGNSSSLPVPLAFPISCHFLSSSPFPRNFVPKISTIWYSHFYWNHSMVVSTPDNFILVQMLLIPFANEGDGFPQRLRFVHT